MNDSVSGQMLQLPPWQTIDTVICDDKFAWVRWDGSKPLRDKENITCFDNESTPEWWTEQGATHWREATEAELKQFWEGINKETPQE